MFWQPCWQRWLLPHSSTSEENKDLLIPSKFSASVVTFNLTTSTQVEEPVSSVWQTCLSKPHWTKRWSHCVCSPSHSMPVLSREKPLEHSQLKLPGVLTQEAREPHALFWALHSLLSAKRGETHECVFFCCFVKAVARNLYVVLIPVTPVDRRDISTTAFLSLPLFWRPVKKDATFF